MKLPFRREPSRKDFLLASIDLLSTKSKIYGRKKLMKLMFFLEHLDIERDTLTPDQKFCKNEFVIYDYGPFSFDVMDDFGELKEEGKITENTEYRPYTIELTNAGKKKFGKIKEKMDQDKVRRIGEINERFSDKLGWELEKLSLNYLKVEDEKEKRLLKGTPVRVVISEGL